MDTRELQTFVTVCETRNYQKAADLLQYAPSTIFKHVQTLENELGTRLLIHENRMLKITEEGKNFLPHAQAILAEYKASIQKSERSAASLTVGGCELNVEYSLTDLFTGFARANPGIHLNMITSPNASVPDMVRSGQVDIGFFYGHSAQHRELETHRMYREPAYLVASRTNPLIGREKLHYEELSGLEFVYPHDSCCFVRMLMPELQKRQVKLKKITFLGGMHFVTREAGTGNALTLAPENALEQFDEIYDLVPLDLNEEPMWAWESILVGKRAEMPEVKKLIEYAQRWSEIHSGERDFQVTP